MVEAINGNIKSLYAVAVGIGISGTYCSKLNAWRPLGPNLWLSGKRPKNGRPVRFWRRAESSKELHLTPFGTTQQFLYCLCTLAQ